MALINFDITVLIAEKIDVDSILPFMLTSKTIYELVRGHERSIVKAKIACLFRCPLLTPTLGSILSSSAPLRWPGSERSFLAPLSFRAAAELEARTRRIHDLFHARSTGIRSQPLIESIKQLTQFRGLPQGLMERVIDGFKDACRVADSIADCAALLPPQQRGSHAGLWHKRWATEHAVHLARQKYIRSLAAIRLAFLNLLASLAGLKYAQELQSPESDPLRWERVTAFKETFLRHGTVVIHALSCPSEGEPGGGVDTALPHAPTATEACRPVHVRDDQARFYASQVAMVLGELIEYERGHWVGSGIQEDGDGQIPDSLHMTMIQAFYDRRLNNADEEGLTLEGDSKANGPLHNKADANDHRPSTTLESEDPSEGLILRWLKN